MQNKDLESAFKRMTSKNEHDLIYGAFDMINEIKKLNEYKKDAYYKFIPTGELKLFDYGVGMLCVKMYLFNSRSAPGNTQIRVYFQTADDGDFGGWSKEFPAKKARQLLKGILKYFDDLDKLPTEEEMNKKLVQYGITVGYE